ncbi:unnamed protein product [Pedinophyceae sp. YPF-701]|nr:unnamed protein product [Pedinophyceae sp. YPF-701]
MAKMESLDYEVPENLVYRSEQHRRQAQETVAYAAMRWGLCAVTAILLGCFSVVVNMSVENISNFKFWATFEVMKTSWLAALIVYTTINVTLVAGAASLTSYFAPAAAGSGIPDVKIYLNGVDMPGVLLFRTLIAKLVGSVGSVAGGLPVGKEGPFVHIGSCIASLLGQGGSKRYSVGRGVMKRFRNDRDQRDLVTCGSAAGVTAAFRAPVGGVLFALEEGASFWRSQLLWRCFFTTAVVSVTVRMLVKLCHGSNCGVFGSGGFIIFEVGHGAQDDFQLRELVPLTLLGVFGGLSSSVFIWANGLLCKWRRDVLGPRGPKWKVIEAMCVTALVSLVSLAVPAMVSCQPCPPGSEGECPRRETHHGNFVPYMCPGENQYNDLATLFFNTQDNAIRNLLGSNTAHEFRISTLFIFWLFFYLLAMLTYGMCIPSGLFVPTLLTGAAYGRIVGVYMSEIGGTDIDEGTYALLGAASFMGGAMRMTVSLCVILLELTNNLNLLPLMMLVLIVSKAVGDATGVKAIYDFHVELKRAPFLEAQPERFTRALTAADAMAAPVVSFNRFERAGALMRALRGCEHNGFPVYASDQRLLGIVTRAQILHVLADGRMLQPEPTPNQRAIELANSFDLDDFTKPATTHGISVDDVRLNGAAGQLDLFLDLAPYVNPCPYMVQSDASLTKVYALFRTLGLRHLFVIPHAHEVVGVITRKDLVPELLEEGVSKDVVLAARPPPHPALRRRVPGSANGAGAGTPRSVQMGPLGRQRGREGDDGLESL